MRVVIDTNVVVSAFLSSRGDTSRIFHHFSQQAFDLIVSKPILAEYHAALMYPKVVKYHQMSKQQVMRAVTKIQRAAIMITAVKKVQLSISDKDDIKFISCAVAGNADYIVSGDKLVQKVGEYKGVQMVTPSVFLRILKGEIG